MLDRDLDRIADIREHTDKLAGLLRGKFIERFLGDEVLQWATERLLEIIGEAASALSDEAHEEIDHDWAGLRRLRNVLAHQYGRIDARRIHHVASEEIPRLRKVIEPYVELA